MIHLKFLGDWDIYQENKLPQRFPKVVIPTHSTKWDGASLIILYKYCSYVTTWGVLTNAHILIPAATLFFWLSYHSWSVYATVLWYH